MACYRSSIGRYRGPVRFEGCPLGEFSRVVDCRSTVQMGERESWSGALCLLIWNVELVIGR